jgi:murein DD-endopeptidase MepM/ murein hydrolase activator NlpD
MEKFIYNKNTLQYEKLEVNWKEQAIKVFSLISAMVVTSLLTYPIWQRLFPTAEIQKHKAENEQLVIINESLSKQVELQGQALAGIQNRDANLYRMMFNMDPIDPSVWQGGTGGHDPYAQIAKFESAKTVVGTMEKVERLSQQLKLQSKSLDTLASMAREKEKMMSSIPSIKPVRADLLAASLDALSGFGYRLHPIHKVRRFHKGIDFSADKGTAIQATGEGVIEKADYDGGYGKCVIINHGYGYKTLYGHMSQIDVKEGDKVKKGQRIGLIGSTGSATGPHLHYEIHVKGEVVNPIPYCLDGLSPTEYQALVAAASREGSSRD